MKRHNFPIIIEKDKDGYFAYCPDFQGCYTQGESYEEALGNIKDAIELHIQDRGTEEREEPSMVSVSTVEVSI